MTTREQIIAVASRSFFTKGYHHTTFRAIAEECGLSTGNVTYYFRQKEDMLLGFYSKAVEVINDAFAAHEELHVNGVINYIILRYTFLFWMKESPKMYQLYTDTLRIDRIRDEYNKINLQLLQNHMQEELSGMDKRDVFLISSLASGGEQELMHIYSSRINEIDFDYLISFSFKTLFLHLGRDEQLVDEDIKAGFANGRKLYDFADEYIQNFVG